MNELNQNEKQANQTVEEKSKKGLKKLWIIVAAVTVIALIAVGVYFVIDRTDNTETNPELKIDEILQTVKGSYYPDYPTATLEEIFLSDNYTIHNLDRDYVPEWSAEHKSDSVYTVSVTFKANSVYDLMWVTDYVKAEKVVLNFDYDINKKKIVDIYGEYSFEELDLESVPMSKDVITENFIEKKQRLLYYDMNSFVTNTEYLIDELENGSMTAEEVKENIEERPGAYYICLSFEEEKLFNSDIEEFLNQRLETVKFRLDNLIKLGYDKD